MSTELAVRSAAFEPSNLTEAMQLAKTLSTSGLMPAALVGKPADVLVVMLKGRELGLSTMQAIGGINVIKGKPVLEAAMLVGLCLGKPEVCEYFSVVQSTDQIATYATKRRGAPAEVRMSFTLAEAQRAGLTGKDNWKNFPAAMLRARAAAALGRAVYPDLVAGIYVPGEIPGSDAEPREIQASSVVTISRDQPGATPGPAAGAGSEPMSSGPSAEASVSQHLIPPVDDYAPEDIAAAQAVFGGVTDAPSVDVEEMRQAFREASSVQAIKDLGVACRALPEAIRSELRRIASARIVELSGAK